MSPTKNLSVTASESSRPRKISTQKKSKAFKQRKIPKALDKVVSNISPTSIVFNLLTSRIAFMYLRSQVGRFHERRHNVVSHVELASSRS